MLVWLNKPVIGADLKPSPRLHRLSKLMHSGPALVGLTETTTTSSASGVFHFPTILRPRWLWRRNRLRALSHRSTPSTER